MHWIHLDFTWKYRMFCSYHKTISSYIQQAFEEAILTSLGHDELKSTVYWVISASFSLLPVAHYSSSSSLSILRNKVHRNANQNIKNVVYRSKKENKKQNKRKNKETVHRCDAYRPISNIRFTKYETELFHVSSCSRLCPIHSSQVLNREWRCSWGSADRRLENTDPRNLNYQCMATDTMAIQGASAATVVYQSKLTSDNSVCASKC